MGLQADEPLDLHLLAPGSIHVRFEASATEPGRPPEEQCQMILDSLLVDPEAERALISMTGEGGAGPASLPAVERIRSDHLRVAEVAVRYLRWRMHLGGLAAPIVESQRATWIAEDGATGPIPEPLHFELSMGLRRSSWGGRLPADAPGAITSGLVEPLGHELLREAADLQHTSLRSALILSVAALEVGVKECVASVAPDTRWLLEEIPSPPVVKLLGEYLPTLATPASALGALPVPADTMDEIKSAVADRNRLVHRGQLSEGSRLAARSPSMISPARLSEFLSTVQDTLYRLDAFAGHGWAADYFGRSRVRLGDDGEVGSRSGRRPRGSRGH